jgi:hypothetical protein
MINVIKTQHIYNFYRFISPLFALPLQLGIPRARGEVRARNTKWRATWPGIDS